MTTKKAPKPVKAWAILNFDESFASGAGSYSLAIYNNKAAAMDSRTCDASERVIRVLVTPLEKP